jgi:hypothetical protein
VGGFGFCPISFLNSGGVNTKNAVAIDAVKSEATLSGVGNSGRTGGGVTLKNPNKQAATRRTLVVAVWFMRKRKAFKAKPKKTTWPRAVVRGKPRTGVNGARDGGSRAPNLQKRAVF